MLDTLSCISQESYLRLMIRLGPHISHIIFVMFEPHLKKMIAGDYYQYKNVSRAMIMM